MYESATFGLGGGRWVRKTAPHQPGSGADMGLIATGTRRRVCDCGQMARLRMF